MQADKNKIKTRECTELLHIYTAIQKQSKRFRDIGS